MGLNIPSTVNLIKSSCPYLSIQINKMKKITAMNDIGAQRDGTILKDPHVHTLGFL